MWRGDYRLLLFLWDGYEDGAFEHLRVAAVAVNIYAQHRVFDAARQDVEGDFTHFGGASDGDGRAYLVTHLVGCELHDGSWNTGASANEFLQLLFAEDDHLEATEDITVHLLTEVEVKELLVNDEIRQSLMAAPLWKYFSLKSGNM